MLPRNAITLQSVQAAWAKLYGTPDGYRRPGADGYAMQGLRTTGVPGMAIAVVYENEWFFACCGTRDLALGDEAPIDAKTVFPIASLSKPMTSTVVASLVSSHSTVGWYSPIHDLDPSYGAKDGVTTGSLLAHRSGLFDHAGDLLEDLGFNRNYILQSIPTFESWPADPTAPRYAWQIRVHELRIQRSGLRDREEARHTLEDLGEAFFKLYDMNRTSYRHADFLSRDNA